MMYSEILVNSKALTFHSVGLVPCAIGPSGMTEKKREGDGATPVGRFLLRHVYYRTDRLTRPTTKLPLSPISPRDGWCDEPGDAMYNRPVTLPYQARAETMYRDDHLYDICVILGHNDDPPIAGRGSAIFFHLAHDDYRPTQGCVAVARDHMLAILAHCDQHTAMRIQP